MTASISINKFTQKTFFKSSSPVQFVCPRCRDIAMLLRQFIQQSAPSTTEEIFTTSSVVNDESRNILDELRKITSKLDSVQADKNTLKDENNHLKDVVNQNLQKIHEEFQSLNGCVNSSSFKTDDAKLESLLKQHVEQLSTQISTIKGCNAKIFTRESLGGNAFEWSFSALNKSLNNTQSTLTNEIRPDLFQLWHSFESNTWSSFDAISNSLKVQAEQMTAIQRQLGLDNMVAQTNNKIHTADRSALVIAIEQDTPHSEKILDFRNDMTELNIVVDKISETVKSFDQKITEAMKIMKDNKELKEMESAVLDILDGESAQAQDSDSQLLALNHDSLISVSNNLSIDEFHDASLDDLRTRHGDLISNGVVNNMEINNHSSNIPIQSEDKSTNSPKQQNVTVAEKRSTDRVIDIFVSNCSNDTKANQIVEYISNVGINKKMIHVFPLIKRSQNVSLLPYVSFKITANTAIAEQLLNQDFWPSGTIVKKFIPRKIVNQAGFSTHSQHQREVIPSCRGNNNKTKRMVEITSSQASFLSTIAPQIART